LSSRALFLILVLALSATAVHGLTASIGNARMIINTDASPESPAVIQKSIKVNNVNNISIDISISPSGKLKPYLELLDTQFTLAPGESKDAKFVITLPYGGTYDGKIMVNFKATDPNFKTPPVGLASTVIVIADGPENPNPPAEEEITEVVRPEQPEEGQNTTQPEPTGQPTETPEQPTTAQQTAKAKPKASPLVGIGIIFVVLVIGSLVYWWYIRR